MPRPRPAGLHDGYVRLLLWIDAQAMDTAQVDAMVTDLLAVAERYAPACHIEMPLGLGMPDA